MRALLLLVLGMTSCGWFGQPVSPLASAARAGDVAEIERLASTSPLDEPTGVNNWTPLMHAIHKNQPASVDALLAAGAKVNRESGRTTALIMAAGYGYADIVRVLLSAGADPRLAAAGTTALEAAVVGSADSDRYTKGQCQTATVRALLDRDPGLRASEGPSVVKLAALDGCKDVVALLQSN